MKKFTWMVFIMCVFAAGASAAPEMKGDPDNGAKVFADSCVRCHNVRQPSNLSESRWHIAMQHMRVRAGLTGKQTRDTLAFILQSKQ